MCKCELGWKGAGRVQHGGKERVKPGPGWIKELKIKCEFFVTIPSVRSGGFSYTVSRRTRPKT